MFRTVSAAAERGRAALASATPVESGVTQGSWSTNVKISGSGCQIEWINSHYVAGKPLVIMLVYGHGTNHGGYVQGRNFVSPAIEPIFDQIADEVWKAVMAL
jgi:hypothetical protein